MRINAASKLTLDDVREALNIVRRDHGCDIYLDEGWQGPKGQVVFYCNSAHGRYATNRHNSDHGRAATWSAWGYLIAELFNRDPDARIGQYKSRDHFVSVIYDAQERYVTRRAFGLAERKGEPGQDIAFVYTLA